jgi:hypothetical protein
MRYADAPGDLVRDRLPWMRICGPSPADPVPDARALLHFAKRLIRLGALNRSPRLDGAACSAAAGHQIM